MDKEDIKVIEALPKMDLIDKILWILLANTLEKHGLTTGEMITVAKGYKKTEIYEVCKDYIEEEMLEATALMATYFAGEWVGKIELAKKQKKGSTGCAFNDILG